MSRTRLPLISSGVAKEDAAATIRSERADVLFDVSSQFKCEISARGEKNVAAGLELGRSG
jgi:hypothetical protein